MKTLTALTAVAALVAGISIANAAGTSGSTMSGSESANSRFCAQTKAGALNCTFASRTDCQKVAQGQGATCIVNPANATTGSGASSKMNKMEKK